MNKKILEGLAGKLSFKHYDQNKVRKHAQEAALYVLVENVDFYGLSDPERAILQDIANRLLVKYFNGREMELLTTAYTTAEATDITMERNAEITHHAEFGLDATWAHVAVSRAQTTRLFTANRAAR